MRSKNRKRARTVKRRGKIKEGYASGKKLASERSRHVFHFRDHIDWLTKLKHLIGNLRHYYR
ncbi:hypothetical protein T02_2100 [Trichinella nativa]|uniref:Uncharacterized protein n=1 Tax=Trichinella nativa TaxID=6335 RepID=A0A0V1KWK4_9BILA|nr:hypothetical protein T02_2100 [Trichinella nativa]